MPVESNVPYILGGLAGAGIAALVILAFLWWLWKRDRAVSIPVAIDACREVAERPMTRAIYFIVSADRPHAGWTVLLRPLRPPLRVLGESGIIYRPSMWSRRFHTAEQVDRLFNSIEQDGNHSVEIEDLWIPIGWFGSAVKPERGEVYRVPIELFELAHRYRDGEVGVESLMRLHGPVVSPSPEEQRAFEAWTGQQITVARQQYHERAQSDRLPKREN